MAQTVITTNDALAVKQFGVATFYDALRKSAFRKKLIGPAPKQAQAVSGMRMRSMQSSPSMPIVSITDLNQAMGDRVSVDMFGALRGRPTMGDRKLSGRGERLTSSTMDIIVDQMRHAVDPGGKMTMHRTIYDLRQIARANLGEWFGRLLNQLCHVHLAGARGTDQTADWILPLADDAEFNDIVVNELDPPSWNRRFVVGSGLGAATSTLGATDILTLDTIAELRNELDTMANPPHPIQLPGYEAMMDEERPLYLLYVTPNQWYYLSQATRAGNNWRDFLAAASNRANVIKHPLFQGVAQDCMGMWEGILIKQINRPIAYAGGESVPEYASAGARNASNGTVDGGATLHRALLLGGQALGEAWGNARPGSDGAPMRWYEERTDHDNALEVSGALIGGYKKFKFRLTAQDVEDDFGVVAVDSHAPEVQSTQGRAALTAVRT